MNQVLKELVDKAFGFCDYMGEQLNLDKKITDDLKNSIRSELISYIGYLSASDGVISQKETKFLADYFSVDATPDEFNELIKKKNIYSVAFEQRMPASFEVFVNLDNAMIADGIEQEFLSCKMLYTVYELLGKELILCDGDASEQEKIDYEIYMTMLKTNLQQQLNLSKSGDVVTGYTKQGAEVIAPPKNGDVEAPKKKE